MSVDTIHPARPAPRADTATARAAAEPTAGIDWASDEHAVAVVDASGVQLRGHGGPHQGGLTSW